MTYFLTYWEVWLGIGLFVLSILWIKIFRKKSPVNPYQITNVPLENRILTWVQIAAYVLGSMWAIYTFIYEKIILPKTAPINVSLDVKLKNLGRVSRMVNGQKIPFVAIGMNVVAVNPSTRTAYLLPSAFIAHGHRVVPWKPTTVKFENLADSCINLNCGQYIMSNCRWIPDDVLATGSLIEDDLLQPGETTERQLVFYVPAGSYDLIEVKSSLPYFDQDYNVKMESHFIAKDKDVHRTYFLNGIASNIVAKNGYLYLNGTIPLTETPSTADIAL